MEFKNWFLLSESVASNFDTWLELFKKNPPVGLEDEVQELTIPEDKKKIIIDEILAYSGKPAVRGAKQVKNDQNWFRFALGYYKTKPGMFREDLQRAFDIVLEKLNANQINNLGQIGWYGLGKKVNDFIREKANAPISITQQKKIARAAKVLSGDEQHIQQIAAENGLVLYLLPSLNIEAEKKITPEGWNRIRDVNSYLDATTTNQEERNELLNKIRSRQRILCNYGKNTDWCTAAPDGDYHIQYLNTPIYILQYMGKPRYQFSPGDIKNPQFMDINDNSPDCMLPFELNFLKKHLRPVDVDNIKSFIYVDADTTCETFIDKFIEKLTDGSLDKASRFLTGGFIDEDATGDIDGLTSQGKARVNDMEFIKFKCAFYSHLFPGSSKWFRENINSYDDVEKVMEGRWNLIGCSVLEFYKNLLDEFSFDDNDFIGDIIKNDVSDANDFEEISDIIAREYNFYSAEIEEMMRGFAIEEKIKIIDDLHDDDLYKIILDSTLTRDFKNGEEYLNFCYSILSHVNGGMDFIDDDMDQDKFYSELIKLAPSQKYGVEILKYMLDDEIKYKLKLNIDKLLDNIYEEMKNEYNVDVEELKIIFNGRYVVHTDIAIKYFETFLKPDDAGNLTSEDLENFINDNKKVATVIYEILDDPHSIEGSDEIWSRYGYNLEKDEEEE